MEECALYPYTIDNMPHCEVGAGFALPHSNDYPLKVLSALPIPFFCLKTHLYCVTSGDRSNIGVGFSLN